MQRKPLVASWCSLQRNVLALWSMILMQRTANRTCRKRSPVYATYPHQDFSTFGSLKFRNEPSGNEYESLVF